MTIRLLVRGGHVISTDEHVNDPRSVGALVEDRAIALVDNGLAA
jgi:hypothetical protein